MSTVEIFVTVIVVLAMTALGVLLIHLLDARRDERVAAFPYGCSRPDVPGRVPSVPRKADGR
ncbi:hypothetical protein ACE1N8_28195 [Streptomyces sp. DSM 116494]|uniref:hypothetical protein n=1 Tax=Streptomyces okerensis TaxID=3344655 RepID=UPI00388EF308